MWLMREYSVRRGSHSASVNATMRRAGTAHDGARIANCLHIAGGPPRRALERESPFVLVCVRAQARSHNGDIDMFCSGSYS